VASSFLIEPNMSITSLDNPNEQHQYALNISSQPTTLHFFGERMCTNKTLGVIFIIATSYTNVLESKQFITYWTSLNINCHGAIGWR